MKNGSYHDSDCGADPDVFLKRKKSFYDRNRLTEIINSLQQQAGYRQHGR